MVHVTSPWSSARATALATACLVVFVGVWVFKAPDNPKWRDLPKWLRDLLSSLVSRSPEERPTARAFVAKFSRLTQEMDKQDKVSVLPVHCTMQLWKCLVQRGIAKASPK